MSRLPGAYSAAPAPSPVYPHVLDLHKPPEVFVAVEKFNMIKVNNRGKRQHRVLALSEEGIQNMKGTDVQWFRSTNDIFGIEPFDEDGKCMLRLTTLNHYYFLAESPAMRTRCLEGFRKFKLGKPFEDVPESARPGQGEVETEAALPAYENLGEEGIVRLNINSPKDVGDAPIHIKQEDDAQPVIVRRCGEDDFEKLCVVGKGSFGKVYQVRKRDDGKVYAMKVLRKRDVYLRGQVEHTVTEQSVLAKMKHPFLVNLHYSFQDEERLFMVMDFVNGGELFFHLGNVGCFPEKLSCFYCAELVLALGFLHEHDIIYRDLKPENILLDAQGHVRVVDFGLAKMGITSVGGRGGGEKATTFCGTPEYLAPEIISNSGHGKAVDWWSLGILLFELLTGAPPFYHENRNEMYASALRAKVNYPQTMSRRARDLCSKLIRKDATRRLGTGPGGIEEIKAHPFFRKIDWTALEKRMIKPPFKPKLASKNKDSDVSNFDSQFTQEDPEADDEDPEFEDYFDFGDDDSSSDEDLMSEQEKDEHRRMKEDEKRRKRKQLRELKALKFENFTYVDPAPIKKSK